MGKQVPLTRAAPLWGGIGEGGFGIVTWHKFKKMNQADWVKELKAGKLVAACKAVRPDRTNGPWHILCGSESFLKGKFSRRWYKKQSI